MVSLLINAFKSLFNRTEDDELSYDDIIAKYETFDDASTDEKGDLLLQNELQSDEGCFYRDGIVTSITADSIVIDDRYQCDLINCPMNLDVGAQVHYLAFQKHANRDLIIRKIISISNDTWERSCNEVPVDIKKHQMMKRTLVAKVSKREGRSVLVEPMNIRLNLDKIDSTFVPYVGDWLTLEALVELDEESGDLGGEILEVDKIQPLRSKFKVGNVTKYDSETGAGSVEKDTVFNKNSCQSGYIPNVGDKVVYDSIESDQGIYTWRCLTVVPLVQVIDKHPAPTTGLQQKMEIKMNNLLLRDKCGISITDDLQFDLELNKSGTLDVFIENHGHSAQTILKCVFMSKKSQSQLSLLSPNTFDTITIKPGETKVYIFKCNAKFMGLSEELFIFTFKGFSIGRNFRICTSLKNSSMNTNMTTGNYDKIRHARQDTFDQGSYIPGIRPYKSPLFVAVKSGIFKVPQHFWDVVLSCINNNLSQIESEAEVGYYFPYLHDGLTFSNYKERFHALLYLEEISLTVDMQKYDMDSAIMYCSGEYLVLKVPGLAEKRPSLIVGDRALVTFKWDSSAGKLKHEGYIHKVRSGEIYLKFNPRFHDTYNSKDCQITFKSSYGSISRCHNAVNLTIIQLGPEILFPTSVVEKEPQINLKELESEITEEKKLLDSFHDSDDLHTSLLKQRKLVWYNKRLNHYQKEAVRNILRGASRPLPYVIFGPPGTGKTITLCETVLQIITTIPESRLLIATPSNSSANLIAERLLDSGVLKPGDLVRLIARHCLDDDSIPEKLLPYCATGNIGQEGTSPKRNYKENEPKINCTISVLGRHRITVGTCIALGILYNMGFPKGHFTHIIVDEAGQASEPEIMVPLSFIHSNTGQIILAGDPMQLGPFVNSKLASYFGLGESFLTRLLQQFPYQRDPDGFETGYDPRLVTKLLINYRSLPELLELPNSMFYDSELKPHVCPITSPEAELLRFIASELPIRVEQPPAIVFHGIVGNDCQDVDSPSWYNPVEAAQVYSYLAKFYENGLNEHDIGIITPYKKQVAQIRTLLWELDMQLPKIGSVEEFQGQERKIIVISTVRSNTTYISNDIRHALGFVASPRRLNVAITRARALLIILGNPYLLSQDPYWRNVLKYCIKNGACTGCNFFLTDIDNNINDDDDKNTNAGDEVHRRY